MNALELARLLGDLPDEMITETDAAVYPGRHIRLAAVSAVAACIALLIAAAVYPRTRIEKPPVITDTPPAVTTTLTDATAPTSAETTAPTAHSTETTRTETTAASLSGGTSVTTTETGTTATTFSTGTTATTTPAGTDETSKTTEAPGTTAHSASGIAVSDTTRIVTDITHAEETTVCICETTGGQQDDTGSPAVYEIVQYRTVTFTTMEEDGKQQTACYAFRLVPDDERAEVCRLFQIPAQYSGAEYDLLRFGIETGFEGVCLTRCDIFRQGTVLTLLTLDTGAEAHGTDIIGCVLPVPHAFGPDPKTVTCNLMVTNDQAFFDRVSSGSLQVIRYYADP